MFSFVFLGFYKFSIRFLKFSLSFLVFSFDFLQFFLIFFRFPGVCFALIGGQENAKMSQDGHVPNRLALIGDRRAPR